MTRQGVSCTDFSYPTTFEAAARAVADLGIANIDVSVRNRFPLTPPWQVRENWRDVAESRRRIVERYGLRVADVFCISHEPRAFNDPDRSFRSEQRAVFQSTVEFAASLGSPGITVLPGSRASDVDDDEPWQISVDELSWRVRVAGERGLALSVEPSLQSIASTPQQVAKLLRSVPGLRLTLDYSHFVFQGIEPVEIDPLLRQSRVLQVRQAGPGMLQLPLEEGTIDFRRLFAVSARLFEGTYSLEYVHNPVFRGGEVDVTGESLKLLAVFDASEASRAPTGGERLNG